MGSSIIPFSNSGTVQAANGTLVINGGVIDGQSGTIQIDSGAALDLSAASGDSDTDVLIHRGNDLNLGANDILVRQDYSNANFGVGNAFNPRANVNGAGQILADPASSQTLSGDVLGGNSATPSLNLGNVRVGDSATKNYAINNVGTSGPALRGALQTNNAAGNNGNITDSRLSGSGVTSSNFGPVAVQAATTDLEVTFTPTTAGPLS
ncbi:MAG: hypothetical protein GXP16_03040, partial [Gammaproteobacteria bacterium]|nr:hypothetical protein [Gammaproteobacteria bacterium]